MTVKRRGVLGMSGWLLFVCLFLPTIKVCNEPAAPIEFPPVYGFYLAALVIALIGWTSSHRARAGGLVALFTIWIASAMAFVSIFIADAAGNAFALAFGATCACALVLLVRAAVRTAWSERSVAIGCTIHALISIGWSCLLVFDDHPMWGAFVSLFASSLMLFAALGYALSPVERDPPLSPARVL